jgi:hypothetical protein
MQGRTEPLPDPEDPIVDLFAGETAAALAWTLHLHAGGMEARAPGVVGRVRGELRRRILEPCLARDDFWWMGLTDVTFGGGRGGRIINNWNPWISSNWIATAVLTEDDPMLRALGVAKALRVLDEYLAVVPPDGSCEEGTAYWGRAGATLFEALELVSEATAGAVAVFDHPLLAEVARFPARMQLGGSWFVNFGDGSARPSLPAGAVYRFGRAIGDPEVTAFGAELLRAWVPGAETSRHDSLSRTIGILGVLDEAHEMHGTSGLPAFTWLPGDGVLVARERARSVEGFAIAARAGHNGAPHGHNDVGSFIVAADGEPVIVDAGVGAYTQATFGPDRYTLWTMRSGYHNVPCIGGLEQAVGSERAARDVTCRDDTDSAELRLDLATAYPDDAGVLHWWRRVAVRRPAREAVISDEWQLREPAAVTLNLLLRREPHVVDSSLDLAGVVVTFEPAPTLLEVERVALDDDVLVSAWGQQALWRVSAAYAESTDGRATMTITKRDDAAVL